MGFESWAVQQEDKDGIALRQTLRACHAVLPATQRSAQLSVQRRSVPSFASCAARRQE